MVLHLEEAGMCGTNSRAEYVGCAHEKLDKAFLQVPDRFFFFADGMESCLKHVVPPVRMKPFSVCYKNLN